MSSAARGQGKSLGIAIAVTTVVVALLGYAALHIRLPKPREVAPPHTTDASVGIVRIGEDTNLLQQVELYDPRPLFLPTAINNSDPDLPARLRREPGSAFQAIPPKLTFAEYEMKVALPEPIAVPNDVVQALHTGGSPNPFFTFGRINYPYTPLSPRLAFIEVMQANTGRTVLSAPLKAEPTDKLPVSDWQPLEMMVAVEISGMVGTPTVTKGSGFEEVDDYFRAFLVKQFRLGARLQPGFYLMRIGQ